MLKLKPLGINLIICFFIFFLFFNPVNSQVCTTEEECRQKQKEYEQKLAEIRQQKNTLSAQIQYMDTQIYLTTVKIQETEYKIKKTTEEIENLTGKITSLDTSLNYLTITFVKKIVEGYKRRTINFFDIFLDSKNASIFTNRLKYFKIAQDNDRRLAFKLQQAKINFEEQKQLREEKIVQLDRLKNTLEQQKQELAYQKSAKQKLLADTLNDENVYQELLARAQRQLAAFKSFVQTSGATSPITANGFGLGSDGNYFSQRDARWAYKTIGYSQENILNVGCLITSVAMSLKKKGVDTNPLIIASNPDYFEANTAFMKYRWKISWPNGLKGYQISTSQVDEELNQGNYVIVGINYGPCRYDENGNPVSDHFVVLTKKEGGDYKMHDPLWGPDLNFYSKYNAICWTEVIK